MANYSFSKKAVEDLSKIWNYTYNFWSENQADKYYNELIEYCNAISKNPQIGKTYFQIDNQLWGYLANKHIIFYRIIDKNNIEIIRILHGSMDLKSRINDK
jgi:toxin ParE1/3/4